MITYEEALEMADALKFDGGYRGPKTIDTVYAYSKGKCLGTYNSVEEAQHEHGQDVITEKDSSTFSGYTEWCKDKRDAEKKAVKLWYEALRAEYVYLTDEVFEICYDQAAIDAGNRSYRDCIADRMSGLATVAVKVTHALQGTIVD